MACEFVNVNVNVNVIISLCVHSVRTKIAHSQRWWLKLNGLDRNAPLSIAIAILWNG